MFTRAKNINTTTNYIMLFHFQASAGVGMILAACGMYSLTSFFFALVFLVMISVSIHYCSQALDSAAREL